jgi:hypothetical protein
MDLGLTGATAQWSAVAAAWDWPWRAVWQDDGLSLLLAEDEILVNVISLRSIASESLVGWAMSVGVDGNDPYQLMDAIAEHFGHPAHLPRALMKSRGVAVASPQGTSPDLLNRPGLLAHR